MSDAPSADYDASDPVAENNAHRDEVRRQRERDEALRRILSEKANRAWFHWLLARCHIYASPFDADHPDTNTVMFRLGEENVGRRLFEQAINTCPDLYMKMISEARKEEERLAGIRQDEEKKRQGENDIGLAMQGFDLPPPEGWPGHVPPVKPEGK